MFYLLDLQKLKSLAILCTGKDVEEQELECKSVPLIFKPESKPQDLETGLNLETGLRGAQVQGR